jgi:hypothetical protein
LKHSGVMMINFNALPSKSIDEIMIESNIFR